MASTQHPISTRPEPPGATGYGPRAQCCEPGLVTRHALFCVRHATSGYNDTRLTTEGRKTVDPKSVLNPQSKMPTLSSLLNVQHLIPHQVRDAVLANFTAGTVLESAKGGPLILGYDCDDMATLDALNEFFATQGLPTALTESTRSDYNGDQQG